VTNTGGLSEGLSAYREMLVAADQKGQDEFDMAVLSLSGGGLAVSLAFLSDVIGDKPVLYPAALALAWGCWGFSALAVLGSYWMSNKTIRGMINEIDVTRAAPKEQRYAALTSRLNGAGAVLFVLGVLFITVFAWVGKQGGREWQRVRHRHRRNLITRLHRRERGIRAEGGGFRRSRLRRQRPSGNAPNERR
jgi:hypothetical protein